MTEKELHKLRRQDLLQLMVTQGKEVIQLQAQLAETEERLAKVQESNERLKGRLDDKDVQIERLKGRLDDKDAKILELKAQLDDHHVRTALDGAGSIAKEAMQLSGVFEAAQKAADEYLRRIRELCEEQTGNLEEAPPGTEAVQEDTETPKPPDTAEAADGEEEGA